MIIVDKENRRVIIDVPTTLQADGLSTPVIINEFDKVNKIFLENTVDQYECELVLLEVDVMGHDMKPTGEKVTKAFGRRVGYDQWLIEFSLDSFSV